MFMVEKVDVVLLFDVVIVEVYFMVLMIFDLDFVVIYMVLGMVIIFIGGCVFDYLRGLVSFNVGCYCWVKKRMDWFDVCFGDGEIVVYSVGMFYGEWMDGILFEGNCYVDCFVVCNGKIIVMDVWNDSVECILL